MRSQRKLVPLALAAATIVLAIASGVDKFGSDKEQPNTRPHDPYTAVERVSATDSNGDATAASKQTADQVEHHLRPFEIEAQVENGVAELRGEVDSEIERDLAEELASGVDGVQSVDNELELSTEYKSPSSLELSPREIDRQSAGAL